MDKQKSPDLLSDLPLSIIHVILSLVPIRDAVRTSILSRHWRFIWSSLPRLVFNDRCLRENGSNFERRIHFINQALLLHEGPIHEFQLLLFTKISRVVRQYIDQWLLFLSRNDIRILVIKIYTYSYVVHSSLYSFQYLTHLKLRVRTIPPLPPSFNGFLFLRSLDIHMREEDSSIVESIVSHSPMLEELTLDCFRFSEMTICALNLKYLHISSPPDHLSLCTPLLQELKGCFEYKRTFSIGVESLVFHHLRTIELSSVPFDNKEVTPAVIRLITGAPNLQKLEISGRVPLEDDEPEPDCFGDTDCLWDTESAPDITYDSLKVIKMEDFSGKLGEMKLIEFLLARSTVLETLMYKPLLSISDTKLLKLTTQLLRYRRASANAQIVISEKEVVYDGLLF